MSHPNIHSRCVIWDIKVLNRNTSLQHTVSVGLQDMCVAVCCRGLQCVAEGCSVLQCVTEGCSVLQRVALCCSVLQCVAVCCSVLQCVVNALNRPTELCTHKFSLTNTPTLTLTLSLNSQEKNFQND